MKIKDGFILKDVAGSKIVIATGEQRLNFNGIITFNNVGADVFSLLDGTHSTEDIVANVSEKYGVDRDIVKADIEKLIDKMRKHNLIEE